jgi:hypothetical protein
VSESLKIHDVMKMFQMHLKPVQVHRPGDANFPAARRCWTRVARSLTLSPEQEASTVGMAFTGPAATVYEKVHGDAISATAEELWEKMEQRLYNDTQVQAQRSKFHTARLGTNETIEDFAQRIRDLGTGLPEAAEDSMLLQRFREGLTTTLKLQSLAISAGFDEVVSRVSQMSEVQGKRRQPEWVNEVQEESAFGYDSSTPPGSQTNPVGPDPVRPGDFRVWNRTRKCYKCQRYGHTRSGAIQCGWPDSLQVSGNEEGRPARADPSN